MHPRCCLGPRPAPPRAGGEGHGPGLSPLSGPISISIKDTHIGAEGVSPKASFHKWKPKPTPPSSATRSGARLAPGARQGPGAGAGGGRWFGSTASSPARRGAGNVRRPLFLTCTFPFCSPNLQVGFGNLCLPCQEKQAPNTPK